MSDHIKRYQDALREYEKACSDGMAKINMIDKVGSALRNHYGGGADATAFDMARWPTAEILRESLTKWHSAFNSLREAWDALPEGERIGFHAPPQKMME